MKVRGKDLCKFLLIVTSFLLFSCAHDPYSVAVIDASGQDYGQRHFQYTVKKGDTLYGIAFKYGTTPTEISRLNGIKKPYLIFPKQTLLIYGEAPMAQPKPQVKPKKSSKEIAKTVTPTKPKVSKVTAPVVVPPAPIIVKPKPKKAPVKAAPVAEPPKQKPTPAVAASEQWLAPSSAARGDSFTLGKSSHKGIDFHGKYGSPIKASKSGTVVYAGAGLKAYGLLIIIKHDQNYLSAYAYNKKILVKEGQFVDQNQTIAEMGKKADKVTLHFEIRRNGKSVNPDSLLSK